MTELIENNPDIPEGNILVKNVCDKEWLEGINPDINKFDVILCTMVLEHNQKPQQSMRYMKKTLSTNGKMFVAVPSETDNRKL